MTTRKSMVNYQNSEKGKKAVRNAVNRYRLSDKGKIAYAHARERLKEKNPTYAVDYMRRKRLVAKEGGLCPQCFKNEPVDGRKLCLGCAVKINGKGIYTPQAFK